MVTAETAVAVPVVLICGIVVAALIAVAAMQVRCADAAREAALLVARDAPNAAVSRAVDVLAPAGASLRVDRVADSVEVTVSAPLPAPAFVRRLLPADVVGRAVATRESPTGVPAARGLP